MKINGRQLSKPNEMLLVLPREGEDDIVIKARAVNDTKEFEKICPEPKPQTRLIKGKGKVQDFESPNYLKAMEEYGNRKYQWMMITSLNATPELQWEQVDISNPDTWKLWIDELRSSGFSEYEVQRIVKLCQDANNLTESRLEEARERFLRGPVVEQEA